MRHIHHLFAILSVTVFSLSLSFPASATGNRALLSGFPLLRQQHSLTCESSAASMGTRGALTESQIMAAMPRHPNPNFGFRGNPDGQQGDKLTDYGVYANPIHRALTRFGYRSDAFMYGTDSLIRQYIDRGWPVVVWITYALLHETPRMAQINGTSVILVPREHTVLAVGYDANTVIVQDPWTATRVAYSWREFNRSWGYFGNMGLAMESCPAPDPVSGLGVTNLSTDDVSWSWKPANRAVRYRVKIIRHGLKNVVVFKGDQQETSVTVSSPRPNLQYEIVVTSLSSCNSLSAPRRLLMQVPATLPTPTPTAIPSLTTTPSEVTVVPTPGSTGTPAPTATATSKP